MSTVVSISLGERSYSIHIGIEPAIGRVLAGDDRLRALLVSDSNVGPLYADRCEAALRSLGAEVSRAYVPAGEASKSMGRLAELYACAVRAGLDRTSVIVAVGGGVVGDLAGFAAATYLRGIRYIQVPTSLLAMVDSSVGGKTGVNLPEGKNLVGAFHQPIEVVADLATLATLPDREYASGLAEVVKYGVIWDARLFAEIEEQADRLLARDTGLLERVIARCCEVKAEVVALDEREAGVRAVLNFGHTFAHALETETGYVEWLHGEAVSLGMAYAAELSSVATGFPEADRKRVIGLLDRLGLPVDFRQPRRWGGSGGPARCPDWTVLRRAMKSDKKARRDTPRFVLAERLGAVVFGHEVPEDKLEHALAAIGAGRASGGGPAQPAGK